VGSEAALLHAGARGYCLGLFAQGLGAFAPVLLHVTSERQRSAYGRAFCVATFCAYLVLTQNVATYILRIGLLFVSGHVSWLQFAYGYVSAIAFARMWRQPRASVAGAPDRKNTNLELLFFFKCVSVSPSSLLLF
jgi:hypothetical protein